MNQMPLADHPRPRAPRRPLPPCPHCGGNLLHSRNADYVITSCLACGRYADEQYRPRRAGHRIQLPERATAANHAAQAPAEIQQELTPC